MQVDLNNRIAVVTGGAQGIGRAITERFLANGATVVLVDIDEATARKTATELDPSGRRRAKVPHYPNGT